MCHLLVNLKREICWSRFALWLQAVR